MKNKECSGNEAVPDCGLPAGHAGKCSAENVSPRPESRKKVLIEFPEAVLEQIDLLDSNRSRFVRQSVLLRIEGIFKARQKAALAEGYTANAKLALRVCKEFMNVES